jgi:SnoaL-like protein
MSESLEKRIDRLESIEAIKKLKHRYMNYCDLGYPPAKLGPLFIDDAVWSSKEFGVHPSRRALETFFAGISSQIVFAAHLAMNFIIEVEGDHGTGKWRILMPCTMVENGKKVSRWLLGDYDEVYVRRNGVWLFKSIDFVVNFNVPFDQDWATVAKVRAG